MLALDRKNKWSIPRDCDVRESRTFFCLGLLPLGVECDDSRREEPLLRLFLYALRTRGPVKLVGSGFLPFSIR